jgi:hypothetical protein
MRQNIIQSHGVVKTITIHHVIHPFLFFALLMVFVFFFFRSILYFPAILRPAVTERDLKHPK